MQQFAGELRFMARFVGIQLHMKQASYCSRQQASSVIRLNLLDHTEDSLRISSRMREYQETLAQGWQVGEALLLRVCNLSHVCEVCPEVINRRGTATYTWKLTGCHGLVVPHFTLEIADVVSRGEAGEPLR